MPQVLDHGFVKVIESYGSDESIIEAARESTDKGFRTWAPYQECTRCNLWRLFDEQTDDACSGGEHQWRDVPKGDAGLLGYLYGHKHATPFEFGGLIIQVQAPIFVFREWHRHRTQSYNEMSARYTPLPDLNYVPTVERLLMNSKTNKQAGTMKGAAELGESTARFYQSELRRAYALDQDLYERALQMGVPKELARVHLPVGRYSRMRANANLRNWLAFLTLRMAPTAQWEIRQYANEVGNIIAERFPRTWELFSEGQQQ